MGGLAVADGGSADTGMAGFERFQPSATIRRSAVHPPAIGGDQRTVNQEL